MCRMCFTKWKNVRSDFVTPHDKRHFSAPGIDEGRPAGVDGQIFPAAGAHPQSRILKRLPGELKDCRETTESVMMKLKKHNEDMKDSNLGAAFT